MVFLRGIRSTTRCARTSLHTHKRTRTTHSHINICKRSFCVAGALERGMCVSIAREHLARTPPSPQSEPSARAVRSRARLLLRPPTPVLKLVRGRAHAANDKFIILLRVAEARWRGMFALARRLSVCGGQARNVRESFACARAASERGVIS